MWEAVTCRRGYEQQREVLALWVERRPDLARSEVIVWRQHTRGSVTFLSLVVNDQGRIFAVSVTIDRQFDRPVRSVVTL